MSDGGHGDRSGIDLTNSECVLDGSECLCVELSGDGASEFDILVDDGDEFDGGSLGGIGLERVIDASVIFAEGADADDGDTDGG